MFASSLYAGTTTLKLRSLIGHPSKELAVDTANGGEIGVVREPPVERPVAPWIPLCRDQLAAERHVAEKQDYELGGLGHRKAASRNVRTRLLVEVGSRGLGSRLESRVVEPSGDEPRSDAVDRQRRQCRCQVLSQARDRRLRGRVGVEAWERGRGASAAERDDRSVARAQSR